MEAKDAGAQDSKSLEEEQACQNKSKTRITIESKESENPVADDKSAQSERELYFMQVQCIQTGNISHI